MKKHTFILLGALLGFISRYIVFEIASYERNSLGKENAIIVTDSNISIIFQMVPIGVGYGISFCLFFLLLTYFLLNFHRKNDFSKHILEYFLGCSLGIICYSILLYSNTFLCFELIFLCFVLPVCYIGTNCIAKYFL